jgi:hypothetical protein
MRAVAATALSATEEMSAALSGPGLKEGCLPCRFGGYDLLSEVARGGMGVVYKANHLALGRVVALKMILEGRLGSGESVQRFHQEARAAAALDHPNIVPVFDIGIHEGRHYFTMPFVEGSSLKDAIARGGIPAPAAAAALMRTVAEAVAAAHGAGIVHRDLKPENVLIDRDGRPRVTDFGLAKREGVDTSLTATGQVLGTPAYMAPEQANGETDKIGPTTDVYSLGGILFFALTGRAPFTGRLTEVLMQVGNERPPAPRTINANVPAVLEAICLRCLEKDPSNRYPTARSLAAALGEAEEALRGQPAGLVTPASSFGAGAHEPIQDTLGRVARRPTTAAATDTLVRSAAARRPWLAIAAIVVVLAAVGTGAGLLIRHWSRPKENAGPPEGPTKRDVAALLAELEKLPRRADFAMEVEVIGGHPEENGVIVIPPKALCQFKVHVEEKAFVSVWSIEADGTIIKLFPNRLDTQDLFDAHEERTVPQLYKVRAVPSSGVDRLWVVASEERWSPTGGNQAGDLIQFTKEHERLGWVEKLRGMRGEESTRVSEVRLRYKVVAP